MQILSLRKAASLCLLACVFLLSVAHGEWAGNPPSPWGGPTDSDILRLISETISRTQENTDRTEEHLQFIVTSLKQFPLIKAIPNPFLDLFTQHANRMAVDDTIRFDVSHDLDIHLIGEIARPPVYNFAANSLTFGTLAGKPIVPQSEGDLHGAAREYIRNASGAKLDHWVLPSLKKVVIPPEAQAYTDFVNMEISIESFGNYALSERTADLGHRKSLDAQLAAQISSLKWAATVETESLADVQRQTLMFASQNYMQQARLIELQRDILTAQVMANTLAITNMKMLEKQRYDAIMRNPPYTNDPK